MPRFMHGGTTYEYLVLSPPAQLDCIQSWDYGSWPHVAAEVPLSDGGAVTVYGEASRWTADQIHVRWPDDEGHFCSAWLPTPNVHRLTDSGWDIIEFHETPEYLRMIRWSGRLPGFLPE